MLHLLASTLIWAFSFGLIKNRLAGLDPTFVAAARLLVSLFVMLPFLRLERVAGQLRLRLIALGAVQYGLMYLVYIAAFRYLASFEVALFTVVTPIWVTLLDDLLERRLRAWNLLTALLAVVGAGIVSYSGMRRGALLAGMLLVQLSNVCFAFGQVMYRRWLTAAVRLDDRHAFALLYLGGFAAAALAAAALTDWHALHVGTSQLLVLVYLGAVASGLGFFLWNAGARRVEVGALAVWNDLKVPAAVAVSMLVFGERAPVARLLAGGLVVLAALALQNLRFAPGRGA